MNFDCSERVVPLEFLTAGERGRVVDVDGAEGTAMRLAEIGIRAGIDLQMLRPGRPCIVAVGNQRLSLRVDNSAVVLVKTA